MKKLAHRPVLSILATLSTYALHFTLPLLIAGCADPASEVQSRPCQKLDSEKAQAPKEKLIEVVTVIEDKQIGCDNATTFMTMLSATLFESGRYLSVEDVREVGNAFCVNHNPTTQAAFGSFRTSPNADAWREGCKTGVEDNLKFNPTTRALLEIKPQIGPGHEIGRADPIDLTGISQQAADLALNIGSHRNQVRESRKVLNQVKVSETIRDEASSRLKKAESDLKTAQARAKYLETNKAQIERDRDIAKRNNDSALTERNQTGVLLIPLRTSLATAEVNAETARTSRDAAAAAVRILDTQIASAKSLERQYRSEELKYKSEASGLDQEASRIESQTPAVW